MKNQLSKYEQLVEAQSPEPQEVLILNSQADYEQIAVDENDVDDDDQVSQRISVFHSTSTSFCDINNEYENKPGEVAKLDSTKAKLSSSKSSSLNVNKDCSLEIDKMNTSGEGSGVVRPKTKASSTTSLGFDNTKVQHDNKIIVVGKNKRKNLIPTSDISDTSESTSDSRATCSSHYFKQQQQQQQESSKMSSSVSTLNSNSAIVQIINDQNQSTSDNNQNKNTFKLKKINKSISNCKLNNLNETQKLKSFRIVWKELSFSYKSSSNLISKFLLRKNQSQVLKDVSGSFGSNQLIAVIGPSGCGKTTLLEFLAGNNPSSKENLKIYGLDEPKVAFIGQDDGLLPGLTVRETLVYASKLQNTSSNFNHEKHVKPIIKALGLAECADRSVTKLSGGQAKRVTIGQELLYPTNLLILDEVTSGLDASTSYSIIKLLKKLVSDREYPMTIVISIHQPSARLFSVFDQVYVMSEGCCLYEGSCRNDLINEYLRKFDLECPQFHNIADYLIEIASENNKGLNKTTTNEITIDGNCEKVSKSSDNIIAIRVEMIQYQRKKFLLNNDSQSSPTITSRNNNNSNNFLKRSLRQANDERNEYDSKEIVAMLTDTSDQTTTCLPLYDAIERARAKRKRPLFNQFLTHVKRSLMRISRSNILTYLQLFTYIIIGLQLATFYGPDIGTQGGCPRLPMSLLSHILSNESEENLNFEIRRIQENLNFLLVAVMTTTFAAMEITVITFPMEARTIKREWRNGWYRVSSYFFGRTLADLPFQLTFVTIFCIVIYTLTGQVGLTSWRFGSFVLIIIMSAMVAQTVGFIFGAIFMNNLPAAVFTAPLCIFPALLFSGFFSRVSQIPAFYKPMTYLSHFRYAFDALIVTLYGFDRCQCDQETLTSYHASLENQTGVIKELFSGLFGCNTECSNKMVADEENSIEDPPPGTNPDAAIVNSIIMKATSETTTTPTSLISNFSTTTSKVHIRTFEDSLVDTVFEHMLNSTNSTTTPSNTHTGSATDVLGQKFSLKMTRMLNSQANFGHQVPTECRNFSPYLMNEFDMQNEDLIYGLIMLFIYVIITRLICNVILSFTIATRVN